MSRHLATVDWSRSGRPFLNNDYSRAHAWRFDGGAVVAASSSPHVVKVPLSEPANVDPEEAYVAALSSCHMLWFLDLAGRAGLVVDRYTDQAVGVMVRAEDGRHWIAEVELTPAVEFSGVKVPDARTVDRLHHEAHAQCFLARSVKSEVRVGGSWTYSESSGGTDARAMR